MQSKGNRDQLKRAGVSQKIGFFYKAKSLGAKLEHACSAAFRTPSYVTTPMFEEVQHLGNSKGFHRVDPVSSRVNGS
ncbi:hypothetical protein CR513_34718, partial [Mucuna pruriens]